MNKKLLMICAVFFMLFITACLISKNTNLKINPIGRGINFGNMFEVPPGGWNVQYKEDYFSIVKEKGFETVRLPVWFSGYTDNTPPYTINEEIFERVDSAVNKAIENDLNIILCMHNYTDIMIQPKSQKEKFISMWNQIAERYKGMPDNVYFELLNEPNNALDAITWNELAKEALAKVRETNTDRKVIIGPVNWNQFTYINELELPEDDNLIVTIHYYEPFHFTHQGASWVSGATNWIGTTWDGTDEEKTEIDNNFDIVKEWADEHNVDVFIGEFGAYSKYADIQSRARWTRYVREAAEKREFGWTYWEFCSNFGIYEHYIKQWNKELVDALLLDEE